MSTADLPTRMRNEAAMYDHPEDRVAVMLRAGADEICRLQTELHSYKLTGCAHTEFFDPACPRCSGALKPPSLIPKDPT